MNYKWIEDIEEFQKIQREWDKAVVASNCQNPFLLSDFIITWEKHFRNDAQIRIFVIYEGNDIVGGIPLCLRRSGIIRGFSRILSYIGGVAANYTEPLYVSDRTEFYSAFEKALYIRKDWDALYLGHVRDANKLISELKTDSGKCAFFKIVRQDHMNWAIDLSNGLEQYMSTVHKKLLRDLRAKRKHAIKNYGKLHLRPIKGREEVEYHFDLYRQFSIYAFSCRDRTSNLEDEKYASFLKEFLCIMDEKNRLDAHALLAGNTILAVSFAYKFGSGFDWMLTGFDYKYKYVRPGYLLIEELIRELCRRGQTYYNWYAHERFYKTQWCNLQTQLFRVFLIKRTLRASVFAAAKAAELALRSNKRLADFTRRLQDAVTGIKSRI